MAYNVDIAVASLDSVVVLINPVYLVRTIDNRPRSRFTKSAVGVRDHEDRAKWIAVNKAEVVPNAPIAVEMVLELFVWSILPYPSVYSDGVTSNTRHILRRKLLSWWYMVHRAFPPLGAGHLNGRIERAVVIDHGMANVCKGWSGKGQGRENGGEPHLARFEVFEVSDL